MLATTILRARWKGPRSLSTQYSLSIQLLNTPAFNIVALSLTVPDVLLFVHSVLSFPGINLQTPGMKEGKLSSSCLRLERSRDK